MSATLNVRTATMAQLVAFFNANTGGNQVKKFADRKTAERRVAVLLAEIAEEQSADENFGVDFLEYMAAPGHEHDQDDNGDLTKPLDSVDFAVALGKKLAVTEPADRMALVQEAYPEALRKIDRRNATGPRPEMVASLKIDRRIVDLLTGEEYANACQVWKAGLVSSAQGDRLSAVLYGAFKKTGKRDAICKVNGHSFRLAYL